jgi:hypothetical protein
MKISASGKMRTTEPDFAPYVAAILQYSPAAGIEAVTWYISTALCADSLCNLPISNYKELADFVSQHEPQIVACIAGTSA